MITIEFKRVVRGRGSDWVSRESPGFGQGQEGSELQNLFESTPALMITTL